MAYNANTNWENEKKYLDNLSKNGDAGQKAWAENQKKELASAQSKYSSSSSGSGGSSGGGTSSGGSSGGGSSSSTQKNSQYTAPTLGNTWDANTDYQAIINNAVANKDFVTAAKAEQLRNQKITGQALGTNLITNNYKGWLNNTDYSTQMWDGINSGTMTASEMQALKDAREKKANGTIGMEAYVDDDLMKYAESYIAQRLALEQQQKWQEEYMEDNPKEEYDGKYDARIDRLLNEILNRDDFSYDAMNDPLYQQYAAMYQREGDRAMKETMAEAAAGAGGMNTYAITAAQQANSYYGSKLNDRIPELYQLAYDMYLNDKESKVQDLGILQNMDATQYNRYRDTINDWYNDKNFAYNAYQNAVNQGNWQTNYNYNSYWDNKNYDTEQAWKNKEWDYNDMWTNKEYTDNRADIEYERNQAEEDEAKALIDWYIQNGVSTIDPELISKAGLTQTAVNEAIANFKAEQAKKGTSSSGGSRRSVIDDDDDDDGNGNDLVYEKQEGSPPYKNTEYFAIESECENLISKGNTWDAAALARKALTDGTISQEEYNKLLAKNNPLLNALLTNSVPGLK